MKACSGQRAWRVRVGGATIHFDDRLQGRAMTGPKEPGKPADPIIVHPDVRRMLLTQKALVEGGRVLCFLTGREIARTMSVEHTIHREDGKISEVREGVNLKDLPADRWWWD